MKKLFILLTIGVVVMFVSSGSPVFATIPHLINYQGMLTDNSGTPLTGSYNLTFKIWTDTTGGSSLWTETQDGVQVTNGLFNVIMGKQTALNLAFNQQYWLEVGVGAETMPRIRFTSVGYSYRALVADSALVTTPGSGSNWIISNSVIYTKSLWGIARGGANNAIRGDNPQWSMNLGVACTTGTTGEGWAYQTISGGYGNIASNDFSTVGGGSLNTASEGYATVSGGHNNVAKGYATVGGGLYNIANGNRAIVAGGESDTASGMHATIGGGWGNKTSGDRATVGGGVNNKATDVEATVGGGGGNVASGRCATIPGGLWNLAQGTFSFAAGWKAKALYAGSFVWADSTDLDFNSQGANTFNIRATGGVYSVSGNSFYGAQFQNDGSGDGIRSYANASNGNPWGAIYAINNGTSPAIYAKNVGAGKAGYFDGAVEVIGFLYKTGGGFKIDHPVEPENKYLYHSFVESPDMKNVYDGVVTLDGNGEARVELPQWFEMLNRDFRYQLTCIGAFAPVYIAEKISNNQFKIAGGQPGMEISWQVTGIRQDPYAEKHRISVEVEKPVNERGKYLHPDVYNLSETMGINYTDKEKRK